MSSGKEGPPAFKAPPLSCDAHFHVFGKPGQYPYAAGLRYTPPHAPLEEFLKLARHLGMERYVFVQPSAYGRNNDCMLDAMKEVGIAGDVGLATGYVLRFSNGLVAYLSGDTGITADQDLVVRGHYNAKLVVMNIGDAFTTGPVEAAYVINSLVKPNAVIPSHANEVGTVMGKVRPGSRTEAFINAVKGPSVHIPLSGRTMEFDASGKCTAGC